MTKKWERPRMGHNKATAQSFAFPEATAAKLALGTGTSVESVAELTGSSLDGFHLVVLLARGGHVCKRLRWLLTDAVVEVVELLLLTCLLEARRTGHRRPTPVPRAPFWTPTASTMADEGRQHRV
uniref:Uncharacterized protein n=1 Tax=Prymnesium polylepis TaxID=72548 RepID=A0A7S4J6E5_9EUKA|mmetsp:Transcript_40043/g.99621  ORF Transcript_40043/g.99621 Transcript_40043/m.99621 type:complete len:125 (+) Transcript_40043:93-467(+)